MPSNYTIPPNRVEQLDTLLTPLVRAGRKVEGGLGFFFGNVLTVFPAGLIAFMLQDAWRDRRDLTLGVFWSLAAAAWLCLDVPYLIRLWRTAFRGPEPITFETANRQRVAPLPLRPLIALWWLTHFGFGVVFALLTSTLVITGQPFATHAFCFFLATSYGYAANGYLLNAICALTRSPRARQFVWHSRHTIDVALGLAGVFLPRDLFK